MKLSVNCYFEIRSQDADDAGKGAEPHHPDSFLKSHSFFIYKRNSLYHSRLTPYYLQIFPRLCICLFQPLTAFGP